MSQQTDEKFDRFFVWIYNRNKNIIGAGFLIGGKEIATCAHVVREALGLQDTPADAPEGSIVPSFPFLQQDRQLLATVLAKGWDKENDIAVLKLDADPADSACPAIVSAIRIDKLETHPFCVYGFLGVKGVWADGIIKKKREHGLVQLESASLIGYEVQGGFSGGPVFDKELKKVVGMIVTSDKSVRVSSMMPVEMLAGVCSRAGVNLELDEEEADTAMNISPREICENCLKVSFSARDKEEFISLCMNYMPKIGRMLDEMRSIDWMINNVLDYIVSHGEFKKFWHMIEKGRPNQYRKFYQEWKIVASVDQ